MSIRNSGRWRRALITGFISSGVITKRVLEVEAIATSACASSVESASRPRACPSSSRASASAFSGLRLTMKRDAPALRRCLPAASPISPAPTSSTRRPSRVPKIFFARSPAIELTLTEPSAMVVSLRTFFATAKACEKQRSRSVPRLPVVFEAEYASLTCPRICGSPTTIESRLDATRNTWRTASSPWCT